MRRARIVVEIDLSRAFALARVATDGEKCVNTKIVVECDLDNTIALEGVQKEHIFTAVADKLKQLIQTSDTSMQETVLSSVQKQLKKELSILRFDKKLAPGYMKQWGHSDEDIKAFMEKEPPQWVKTTEATEGH